MDEKMTNPSQLANFFEKMVLIRTVERKVEQLFSDGRLFGTTHSYIGQEAIAVGVISCLNQNDIVISNHRGHGHYLAHTNDVEGLFCELMGKQDGVCGGRGGSQHLFRKNFYSNGITGGMVPVATGMAFAEKMSHSLGYVVCFLGDGAVGEGVFYESLNMASLWQLPIVYVVENNQYAMSTPVSLGIQGSIVQRGSAVGVESHQFDTHDVIEIHDYFGALLRELRAKPEPRLVVFNTYRMCGHSKSDDCCYRSKEEVTGWEEKDPLKLIEAKLDQETRKMIQDRILFRIETAVRRAEASPMASLADE